jgi:hypothetical protein
MGNILVDNKFRSQQWQQDDDDDNNNNNNNNNNNVLHKLKLALKLLRSWGSAVGIATGYRLDENWVGVRVPVGTRIFPFHVVQTGSGAHSVPYLMGIAGSFPRGKAARE